MRTTYDPVSADRTQLLIVGAGPVGLFAGLCAAQRGVDVMLLEQSFNRGHAAVLHPSSVRLLEGLGLGAELLAAGRKLNRVDVYLANSLATTIELPQSALTIPQSVLEEILLTGLRREGVEFKSPCQATALEEHSDRVRIHAVRRQPVAMTSPATYGEWEPIESLSIEATFVLGADGYDSSVRELLGLNTVRVGPLETFALFEGPQIGPESAMALCLGSNQDSVLLPLPDQRMRWGFQMDAQLDRDPDLESLRKLLEARAPWQFGLPQRVDWSVVTHFERRLARGFGARRTWLVGDAAHVTSPFGGQSMNRGLSEAYDLIEAMTACISDQEPLEGVRQVGEQNERQWQRLLSGADGFELLAHAPPWLGEHAQRLVSALPVSGTDLEQTLEQLGLVMR